MTDALSRRALLGAAVTSVAASGQQSAPGATTPEIETARRQQQDAYEQMRKTKLPITVEPATVFKP